MLSATPTKGKRSIPHHSHPARANITAAVLVAVLSVGACRPESPQDAFLFLQTSRADRTAFTSQLSSCESQSKVFTALLDRLKGEPPLAIEVSQGNKALFGQAFQDRTFKPHLLIDLRDLGRLPDVAAVRQWGPDSNWAWTRCEVLGHELAEGIRYRELWVHTTEAERGGSEDTAFTARVRAAHTYALQVEQLIAEAQRTRLDEGGRPYSRTSFCSHEGVIHIIFGRSTETLVLVGGTPGSLTFTAQHDRCSDPAWRDSAVAIQRRFRASLPQP